MRRYLLWFNKTNPLKENELSQIYVYQKHQTKYDAIEQGRAMTLIDPEYKNCIFIGAEGPLRKWKRKSIYVPRRFTNQENTIVPQGKKIIDRLIDDDVRGIY